MRFVYYVYIEAIQPITPTQSTFFSELCRQTNPSYRGVENKGISTTLRKGWWEGFCQRHPKITLRSAIPFSLARAMSSDPDVMDRYFDMLEECLRANDYLDKP